MSLELRADATGTGTLLTGYASVFNTPYEVRSGGRTFTESVAPGAFRRSINNPDLDVQLLVNHEGLPLARTKSGTLKLSEDQTGLAVRADLDPTDPDVQSLAPKIRRGDLSEMSFAFLVKADDWSEDRTRRVLRECDVHRGDVSIVSYGASSATSVSLRAGSGGKDRKYELRRIPITLRDAGCLRCAGRGSITLPCPNCSTANIDDEPAGVERAETRRSYSSSEIARLGAQGKAYKNADGHFSFPVVDLVDLLNAIRAVGRAPASERNGVRRYLIGRARDLGASSRIPDSWNGDGSLRATSRAAMSPAEIELRRLLVARRSERETGDADLRRWLAAERHRYRQRPPA